MALWGPSQPLLRHEVGRILSLREQGGGTCGHCLLCYQQEARWGLGTQF